MTDELWICPDYGHRFVTRNMWHSCSNYPLEYHFEKSDPAVREIFNRYIDAIKSNGPVEIIPQKTRNAIMARNNRFRIRMRRSRGGALAALAKHVVHAIDPI